MTTFPLTFLRQRLSARFSQPLTRTRALLDGDPRPRYLGLPTLGGPVASVQLNCRVSGLLEERQSLLAVLRRSKQVGWRSA